MVDNLRSCVYHPITDSDCPIFRLDHIINEAEKDLEERQLMLRHGAVIRAKLDWDCNLDRTIKLCKPTYSFARLDTPVREETFSVGFNFRFASNWRYGKKYLRMLKKAFGIRLIISVSGKAGKFDFITLTLNTGSIVGIFGLATFFCDIILLHLSNNASIYKNFIIQHVQTSNNNVRSNMIEHNENLVTIVGNPNIEDRQFSQPFWTKESLRRFSGVPGTTHFSSIIDPNQLLRLQPNVGITNTLN
jgi:hypothetical protein